MIQKENIVYKYSFHAPSQFAWGGAPLSMSPNGLYVGGSDAKPPTIGEITIPKEGNSIVIIDPTPINISELASDAKMGNVLMWKNENIVSGYSYYDASGSVKKSHQIFPGPKWYQVGNLGGGYSGGYMGLVPSKWVNEFGIAFTGQCSLSIISRTSVGPCLLTFNPDDLGIKNPVPTQNLLYYTLENPLEKTEGGKANSLYSRNDTMAGVVWIEDSILFFGLHGSGPFCYGTGSECSDPTSPYKGDHAFPYNYRVWAYDAHDLLRVKREEIQSWDVRPYLYWDFELPGIQPGYAQLRPGSLAFDGKRIYFANRWTDPPNTNVFVFEIEGPVEKELRGEITLKEQPDGSYQVSGLVKPI